MKAIFLLFLIPSMLGVAEILHGIKVWILSSGNKKHKIMILIPKNETYHSELVSEAEQFLWRGSDYAERTVVLSDLLEDENAEKCGRLAEKLKLEYISSDMLAECIMKGVGCFVDNDGG